MFDQFTILTRQMIKNNINDFYYLTIDPGLSNIGWCICTLQDFKIVACNILSLNNKSNIYLNDLRFKKIYNYIQEIIIKYNVSIVCLEKNNFSIGRYSFAEQLLLKAIGIICASVLCEDKYIFEISNRGAQKILFGKAKYKNKQYIFEYIYNLISDKINNTDIKKIFTKSKNDICDSFFISYAFRNIILNKIKI